MKTTLLLFLLVSLLAVGGWADTDSSEMFFGGGGPMPTLLFLDLETLNESIIDGGYPKLNEVLFANGGGGFGGALDGLRVGGFGVGGDIISEVGSHIVSLDVQYGGMMIESAVRNEKDFTVVLGTLLGFGSLDLRFIYNIPTTFEEVIANPFMSSISKDFYAVQPYIAFESNPFAWMSARFQLGFLWTLTDPWAYEEIEYTGPPRFLRGLTATLMLRFGGSNKIPTLDEMEQALDELAEELEALDENGDSAEAEVDVPTEAVEEAAEEVEQAETE